MTQLLPGDGRRSNGAGALNRKVPQTGRAARSPAGLSGTSVDSTNFSFGLRLHPRSRAGADAFDTTAKVPHGLLIGATTGPLGERS